MSTTTVKNGPEHVDVLIVGAGISGIGAAHYLTHTSNPARRFAILEARGATGGTWDLFRYPGIRSDSDLHTFGYEFKPWREREGDRRRRRDPRLPARDGGRERHRQQDPLPPQGPRRGLVERATPAGSSRSSATDTGEQLTISCGWLFCAGGYYRYDEGFTPQFEGRERFGGQIVHPQHWPEDLDYRGKRVVVIGSGATAVTLVPAHGRHRRRT